MSRTHYAESTHIESHFIDYNHYNEVHYGIQLFKAKNYNKIRFIYR